MKMFLSVIQILAFLCCAICDKLIHNSTKGPVFLAQETVFQNELLHMLGLTPPESVENQAHLNTAGTRFLLDIYKFNTKYLYRSNNKLKRSVEEIDLSEDDQRKIDQSNVIVTLENVIKRSVNNNKRKRLSFTMPRLTEIKKLVSAELRLYQTKTFIGSIFIISVYEATKTKHGFDGKLKKIGEKLTSSDYTGWLSVDISFIFNSWLEQSKLTQNLYVTVAQYNDPEKEMSPSVIGLQTTDSNLKQPFIVAYMKGTNQIRLPRSSFFAKSMPSIEEITQMNEPCELRVLKVPFKELYRDWVIAPEVFEASLCTGHCQFPLKPPVHASNHAIIQSLVNLKQPGRFPKPCCVPSKHMPMSVVVREDQNHILRNFEDMIAVNCECQ